MRTATYSALIGHLCLTLSSAAPAQRSQPKYPALTLTTADLQADVQLLRRALAHVHPGLTRYISQEQLDAAFAGLTKASAQPMSDLEFYRAVSVACAKIRCGHTRVMAPRIDAHRKTMPAQLPFTFRIFDGELVVDTVAPGVVMAGDAKLLRRGDRILRIEDRLVSRLIDEIGATVCLDGGTDSVRTSRLDTAYEFADSGLDHYLPAWIGFRSQFRLVVRRGEKTFPVTVPAVDLPTWLSLAPTPRDFADATSWRKLDSTTAVLTVDSFVNYRKPIDATKRYQKLFRAIRAAKIQHLIVDLRNNGGGSTDASWPLASFLIEDRIVATRPPIVRNYRCPEDLRKHLSTWEKGVWSRPESLFKKVAGGFEISPMVAGPVVVQPHPDRFRGRITVLTSRYNASGSTMLVACLQKKAGIRLVGEPTGGAPRGPTAGLLFTLTLPKSRLRVNIPALRERTTVDEYAEGAPVLPDLQVETTRADFLARRDPVLTAARR